MLCVSGNLLTTVLKVKNWVVVWVQRASLVAQRLKHLPPKQETQVRSLGWEDPLEKEMSTHPSVLVQRIPSSEELVGYSPWSQSRTRLNTFTSLLWVQNGWKCIGCLPSCWLTESYDSLPLPASWDSAVPHIAIPGRDKIQNESTISPENVLLSHHCKVEKMLSRAIVGQSSSV